ncbi:TetR/AcrR family transcriptional regulator [Yinghuangia seranimata]|uniref:TetR/AcrR family transcriptional regulator n=1 Tax=Yinghuangia seranimata TaxID=408067 RepID=UPI00248C499E|nr:TetR family transcriptional regulator [Yinghuangia seranimata]MDI2130838.1 TetR family transcriptional regulator [Yinghuangia seranimata]
MRQNPARRAALLDAAIAVLAEEGARGLTLRAVDKRAGVPTGTATNYFPNRDELLNQVGMRVFERMAPGPEVFAAIRSGRHDREHLVATAREIFDRVTANREGWLALLELRLEATRRPELRTMLTGTISADLTGNVERHPELGMPGDADTVVLLYLALNWLVLERLTLPDVIPEERVDELIRVIAERALPR